MSGVLYHVAVGAGAQSQAEAHGSRGRQRSALSANVFLQFRKLNSICCLRLPSEAWK